MLLAASFAVVVSVVSIYVSTKLWCSGAVVAVMLLAGGELLLVGGGVGAVMLLGGGGLWLVGGGGRWLGGWLGDGGG